MLTYFARPRGIYTEPDNANLVFPCPVELNFTFEPSGIFGGEGPCGKTAPLGAKVRLGFDACRGETSVIADTRLPPVDLELRGGDGTVLFEGAQMRVSFHAESRASLESFLETYYYAIPALLSIDMIDAPMISSVWGIAGQVAFCWGILNTGWQSIDVITTEIQEERIFSAFHRLKLLKENQRYGNRRLLAATQYFYMACRLNASGSKLWEFLSETLLNYAKILEVLFPGTPKNTRETARTGLRSLGFTNLEIEALFIPAILLRNSIDVAHPTLSVFSTQDSTILQSYADRAEGAFRLLLNRVFQKVEDGTFALPPVQDIAPRTEAIKVINRIKENLSKIGDY